MGRILVGRDRELRLVDEMLDDVVASRGVTALVSGEPGIGKTWIAEEIGRRASGRGFVVAWGRAWEGEGTPAYFPWLEVLRRLAKAFARPELATLVDTRGLEGIDAGEATFRLLDAVTQAIEQCAETKPIAIILDDLHAADISTLRLFQFVAQRTKHDARVLLVGTTRDVGFQRSPGAEELLAKIAKEATALPLGRLRREDVAAWIRAIAPDHAESVDRMTSISEGNPLFIGELLAAARKSSSAAWPTALPLGIREAIRAHLAVLPNEMRPAVEVASVLGRELAFADLAALLGADPGQAVNEAIAAGIFGAIADDRLRFTHVLIRDEIHHSLPADRRSELHRAAARRERDAAGAARHWIDGARPEDAAEATRAIRAAMEKARIHLAFDDAAELGELALRRLDRILPRTEVLALVLDVGESWHLAGNLSLGRDAGRRATELARDERDAVAFARAALVHRGEQGFGARDEASIVLLREALTRLPDEDSAIRAKVLATLSNALFPAPPEEHDDLVRFGREALAMVARLDDDEASFTVFREIATTWNNGITLQERFDLRAKAITLAKKLGRVVDVLQLFPWQIAAWIDAGDFDAALREAHLMEEILSPFRLPTYRWRVPIVRAMLADIRGSFAEAEAHAREVYEIGREFGVEMAIKLYVTNRMSAMYGRGDAEGFAEVERTIFPILDDGGGLFAIYRSISDAVLGRTEQVRASLALLRGAPLHLLPDVGGLGWPIAELGLVEHAETFYRIGLEDTKRSSWQFGPGGSTSMGPRELVLGRLAVLLDRPADAIRHFEQARAIALKLGARPFIAHADLGLATLLPASEARERAESARSIAHELGMRKIEAKAEALLEKLSGTPSKRTKAPHANVVTLAREGELWRVTGLGEDLLLVDSKGMTYVHTLTNEPCREVHVLELVGSDDAGDAGPMLDEKAKNAYRERASSLRDELEEATKHADAGRIEQKRAELEALATELARAVGLGGRDRRASSMTERARINVQRRIKDVIRRAREHSPKLADHLERSIRTGAFCVYVPVWESS